MSTWQTTASRPKEPRGMHLEERDIDLFETIQAFDGMLGASQIQRLFFASWRVTRDRLSKLWGNGYLNKPSRRQRAALPEMIYWLDTAGAEQVAGRQGIPISDFKWVKRPRWGQVPHDLAVNDFRICVMEATTHLTDLELGVWYSEGEFRSWRDHIPISNERHTQKQIVTPDGYFEILMGTKKFRLLVEIDMATKDNPRFIEEKAKPFLAYIKSDIYLKRFGHNAGRVLVITKSQRRLKHMKEQLETSLANAAGVFLFSTFEEVAPTTVLTEAIWQRGGEVRPSPLFVRST